MTSLTKPDLIERIVEPCRDGWSPRLDRNELPVGFVDSFAGLVEIAQVQEHLADQLVLNETNILTKLVKMIYRFVKWLI